MAVAVSRAEFTRTGPRRSGGAGNIGKTGFRTDIQAMRALAVALVVWNHLWPLGLPGGYVGVDVFFVISGFLISSHLVREIEATGRVRLAVFYARRARRLFPAAFLVLGASMALALLFLPYPRWITTGQEILASVFYGENWLLAAKSVDYSAHTESASAVQHYWSLSVEEQFYLLWPLTLVFFAFFARQRGRRVRRRVRPLHRILLTAVLGIAALSLCYSLYVTDRAPERAYFDTPARVWEFAVGAAIGLAAVQLRSRMLRNVMALTGFAMILFSALAFDASTPFPGLAALVPVMGSASVIMAGTGAGRPLGHNAITGLPPVQFLGKISYSLYLWHWPLIVAAPYVFDTLPATEHKLGILAVSILLAWCTKRWVEDAWLRPGPGAVRQYVGRHAALLPGFRKPVAGMTAVAAAAVLLGAGGFIKEDQSLELAAAGAAGPCYGAAAIGNRDCGDPFAIPVPLPHMDENNAYWTLPDSCAAAGEGALAEFDGPIVCDFSGGKPAAETAWLVGDSHAQHWQAAIMQLAQERRWRVSLSYLGGCPLVDVPVSSFYGSDVDPEDAQHCARWGRAVVKAVETERPDRVFVGMYAAQEVIDDGTGDSQKVQYANALIRDWQRWVDAGSTVVPITDPPLNDSGRRLDCLARNASTPEDCAVPREDALAPNPFAEAAERMGNVKVTPISLTEFFCDLRKCYPAVGGVSVYFDANHLNVQYAKQLAPHLGALLD